MAEEHEDVRARPVRSECAAAGRTLMRTPWWIRSAVGMMAFCVGCPDEPVVDPGDASVPEARPPDAPTPPDISWLEAGEPPIKPPRFTPCPPGWREVADPESGTVTCDPWPEGGPEDCAAVDEAHFPGEPGCTRIGTACSPDDDWATDLPTDQDVFYVRVGAPPDGAGTRDSPFGTIAEALVEARRYDVIALSRGMFDVEEVRLGAGVTLWGACVAETVVTSSTPSESAGTVTVVGSGAVLRNLRLANGRRPALWVSGASRSADLQGVVASEARQVAFVVVDGAVLTGASVVVRDTLSRERDGIAGRAIEASGGAHVVFTRALFERNRDAALIAFDDGTQLDLTDVVVRDTQGQVDGGTGGAAMSVQSHAHATATRAVFEGNRKVALFASGGGTELHLTDVVVRETRGEDSDGAGRGTHGEAVQVQTGALVEVTRGMFERNHRVALGAIGSSAKLHLWDVVVRDTMAQESDGKFGRAMEVGARAEVTATRATFERNRDVAAHASGAGTVLQLFDVVVRDTRPGLGGVLGRAVNAQDGATVEITVGVLAGNCETTVFAKGSEAARTVVRVFDVVFRGTQPGLGGVGGRALEAQAGAHVEAHGVLFERNRDTALIAFGAGTALTFDDVVVRDTIEQFCADGGCAGFGAGTGVGVLGGAAAVLTRFVISDSAHCGIQLAYGADAEGVRYENGGTMDLHEGVISENAVCGANVQTAGFDLSRLSDHVIFRDNGRDLDMSELPVPEAGI